MFSYQTFYPTSKLCFTLQKCSSLRPNSPTEWLSTSPLTIFSFIIIYLFIIVAARLNSLVNIIILYYYMYCDIVLLWNKKFCFCYSCWNQFLEPTILSNEGPGFNESLWWGSNSQLTDYKSNALPTAPHVAHFVTASSFLFHSIHISILKPHIFLSSGQSFFKNLLGEPKPQTAAYSTSFGSRLLNATLIQAFTDIEV